MDEKEKQQALEEEQARLQALKVTHFILFGQIVSGSKRGRLRAAAAERPAAAGQVVTAVSPFKRLFKWHHLIQFIRFRAAPARHRAISSHIFSNASVVQQPSMNEISAGFFFFSFF